jgi:3-hydroxyacyl-CoA dehydrogenase/3a,7a,12a-trihydroxy-5b-cholest-24-enoyl-CoA hydratase
VADSCDVETDAAGIVTSAMASFGRLDIVVNNAGIGGKGRFHEIPPAEFDRPSAINFRGTVALNQAAWPHLIQCGAGRVVNISSQTIFGFPGTSSYICAESAIFGLTRAIALEGRCVNINVNTVMPLAWTRRSEKIPDDEFRSFVERYSPPESVAAFIVWLVHASNRISGETFSVAAGRAGRVVLAENAGFVAAEHTPDAWIGCEQALLSPSDLAAPRNMMEEIRHQAKNLYEPAAGHGSNLKFEYWARYWEGLENATVEQ